MKLKVVISLRSFKNEILISFTKIVSYSNFHKQYLETRSVTYRHNKLLITVADTEQQHCTRAHLTNWIQISQVGNQLKRDPLFAMY